MKKLAVSCRLLALSLMMSARAGMFPYADSLTDRYWSGEVKLSSFDRPYTVWGTKMRSEEHVAVIETDVFDFRASDAENWARDVSSMVSCQAVLSMRCNGSTFEWMGYVGANTWLPLTGKTAKEGEWGTKIEIDYSVMPHLVRYSVKTAAESSYTILKNNNREWLELDASAAKAGDVKFYGVGTVNRLSGRCGVRPIEAKVASSESYDLHYGNLKVDASVSEAWGAENFNVVLKNANGETIATKTATVASGRLVADFSDVAVPGGAYSYSVVLSGIGQQGVVAKGKTDIELFSNVNWFRFAEGCLVNATTDDNVEIVSGSLSQKLGARSEGKILPVTKAVDMALVTAVSTLDVSGAYQWHELPVDIVPQFVLAPARQCENGDLSVPSDRVWAYKIGSDEWSPISVEEVPTENGSYDVKVVFDFAAKKGNCWIKLSTEGDAAYRKIVTDFALTDTKVNNAAIIGGGISALNASFKTTAPAEVLPTGNTIVIDKNAEVRLENLTAGTAYAVQGASGKAHLRWKDAKGDSGTIRWAKVVDGKIEAVDGSPANGVDSFKSHVLGLDPEDAQSRPLIAAEQNAEPDTLVLKLPTVRQRDPSETGVAVRYCLVTSDDTSFATETTAQEVTNVLAGEGPTFTADLPSSGGKVRYYRVKIVMEK